MIWIAKLLAYIPTAYRVFVYIGLAAAVWGTYAWWKHSIYTDGREYERGLWSRQIEENQSNEIEIKQKAHADAAVDVQRAGAIGMRVDPHNRDNRTD